MFKVLTVMFLGFLIDIMIIHLDGMWGNVLNGIESISEINIALCLPKNAKDFENGVDLIVFRNTCLVSGFEVE